MNVETPRLRRTPFQTSYAEKLIPIADKGLCGDAELEDNPETIQVQAEELAQMIKNSKRTIIHTGAGISTSAGVPDFRGPNGVWTCELQNRKLPGTSFEDANPTYTHHSINQLVKSGLIHHVVSQNVDGLHIRSGLPRDQLSEIHGTAFAEWCDRCEKEFRLTASVLTIGLSKTGHSCPNCGEDLRDMLCDWDSELPVKDVDRAIEEHRKAYLLICVGTSLRVQPAGNWPLRTLRKNGKAKTGELVIINLQKTHLDKKATVRIFGKSDLVFGMLMKKLGEEIL
jgi:mono-ADP-ribosyltransferase sirtuin 6